MGYDLVDKGRYTVNVCATPGYILSRACGKKYNKSIDDFRNTKKENRFRGLSRFCSHGLGKLLFCKIAKKMPRVARRQRLPILKNLFMAINMIHREGCCDWCEANTDTTPTEFEKDGANFALCERCVKDFDYIANDVNKVYNLIFDGGSFNRDISKVIQHVSYDNDDDESESECDDECEFFLAAREPKRMKSIVGNVFKRCVSHHENEAMDFFKRALKKKLIITLLPNRMKRHCSLCTDLRRCMHVTERHKYLCNQCIDNANSIQDYAQTLLRLADKFSEVPFKEFRQIQTKAGNKLRF